MRLLPIQRRLLLLTLSGAVGVPVAQRVLKNELFDARQYFVYLGASGPYDVLVPPSSGEDGKLGAPRSAFRGGDWLGWRSNITVEAGIGMISLMVLVRREGDQVVKTEEFRLQPGQLRQGEKAFFQRLPIDLRPGAYDVKRRATFLPVGMPPVSEDFPAIPFEVIA